MTTGTWISPIMTISPEVINAEIRISGTFTDTLELYSSGDGGINWTSMTLDTAIGLFGDNLRIKVVINNINTSIESLVLLWK